MLMASTGALALSACGGGSSGGSSSDSSTAAVANRQKKAATPSASGTTIPPAASIIDASGNTWTVKNGVVYSNGSLAGYSANVTLLLWFGGNMYAEASDNTFWKWTGSVWAPSADPRATAPASTSLFYGINGHMAYNSGIYETMSAAAQVALLQDLGVTNYRADVASGGMAQVLATALKGAFAGSGVSILPVLNPESAGWSMTLSESAAYTLGYNLGVAVATPLKGLVQYIECGNELDVPLQIAGNGSLPNDWSPSGWPAFRGVIRGMIDGVKAVDSTIQCGVNVGIPMAYGALQMLWNGVSPNGTATGVSGAEVLQWDFTSYHWYLSSGDIQCGWNNNSCVNVLEVLKNSFGKPIWLTEWGWSGASDTPAQAAAYVTTALTEYLSVKDTYNIQSVMMYALIDPDYGLIQEDGVTKNPAYAVFKDFVAANPV